MKKRRLYAAFLLNNLYLRLLLFIDRRSVINLCVKG